MRARLCFVVPSLGGGGAEMHLVRLANAIVARWEVDVAVVRAGSFERMLDPSIAIRRLMTRPPESSTLGLIRSSGPLRRLIQDRKPDVVCSMMDHTNVMTLAAVRGVKESKPRMVACTQNVPSARLRGSWSGRLQLGLMRHYYPGADRIVASSEGVARDLGSLIGGLEDKIEVIHNIGIPAGFQVPAPDRIETARREMSDCVDREGRLVVGCGRLERVKGFDRLVEATAFLAERTDARVWIFGEGSERGNLARQIESLGLQDRVRLGGFRSNLWEYLAAADVCAIPSRSEGFGNVIIEAMAMGTAVVSCDCPHGPAEIITNVVNGLLVEPDSAEALARGIRRVLQDDSLRERLELAGRRRAEDFEAGRIGARYEELFRGLFR